VLSFEQLGVVITRERGSTRDAQRAYRDGVSTALRFNSTIVRIPSPRFSPHLWTSDGHRAFKFPRRSRSVHEDGSLYYVTTICEHEFAYCQRGHAL